MENKYKYTIQYISPQRHTTKHPSNCHVRSGNVLRRVCMEWMKAL